MILGLKTGCFAYKHLPNSVSFGEFLEVVWRFYQRIHFLSVQWQSISFQHTKGCYNEFGPRSTEIGCCSSLKFKHFLYSCTTSGNKLVFLYAKQPLGNYKKTYSQRKISHWVQRITPKYVIDLIGYLCDWNCNMPNMTWFLWRRSHRLSLEFCINMYLMEVSSTFWMTTSKAAFACLQIPIVKKTLLSNTNDNLGGLLQFFWKFMSKSENV